MTVNTCQVSRRHCQADRSSELWCTLQQAMMSIAQQRRLAHLHVYTASRLHALISDDLKRSGMEHGIHFSMSDYNAKLMDFVYPIWAKDVSCALHLIASTISSRSPWVFLQAGATMAVFPNQQYTAVPLLGNEKSSDDNLEESQTLPCQSCCRNNAGFRKRYGGVIGVTSLGWIIAVILTAGYSISWWSWSSKLDRICLEHTSYHCTKHYNPSYSILYQ